MTSIIQYHSLQQKKLFSVNKQIETTRHNKLCDADIEK